MVKMVLIIAVLALVVSEAGAAEDPRIKVLIVDGFSNHDWAHTTRLIGGVLEQAGRFRVDVATCPAKSADPAFASFRPPISQYDVVILNCNDLGNGGRWPEAMREDFAKFVRDGGGRVHLSLRRITPLPTGRNTTGSSAWGGGTRMPAPPSPLTRMG